MDKKKILTIVGVSTIVVGSACLYFAGSTAEMIGTLVGAVFVVIGVILSFFKK